MKTLNKFFPAFVRVPVIFALMLIILEIMIDSGDRPAFIKYPMVGLFLVFFFFLLVAFEIVADAVVKMFDLILTDEQKQRLEALEKVSYKESDWYQKLMQKLTRSTAIEREADVELNHNYDGIRELDNVLPPWWVYLFYATILFGGIYLVRFHILGDYTQEEEFVTEMQIARAEVEKYKLTAPDLMDKNKVTLLTDATSIAKGKELYTTNCVACHKADGGGAIGPNLTDEHWIMGGGIKNVFNTIMEGGREGKGMVAWKTTIKPSDIQKIASYILTLQGTSPKEAKAPEGNKWLDNAITQN